MADLKRWLILNKLYVLSVGIIIFLGWMDAKQITPFHILNTEQAWSLYMKYTGPAIWSLWVMIFVAFGIIWYLIFKDKSEAIALTGGALVLLMGGAEDIFFFIFSPQTMTVCMDWFVFPINFVSKYVLGEACVSPLGLILNVALFSFLSYYIFRKLKEAKW